MPRFPLLALLAAACAASPAPAPRAENRAAIAISVRTRGAADNRSGRLATIYFVRLEDDADPTLAGPLLESNYRFQNTVFLLDAEPGRYVAVGGVERREGRDLTTYFSAGLIRATEQEAGPGEFAYLGSFSQDVRTAVAPDEAQAHYVPLISPQWTATSTALKLFTKYRHFFGRDFARSTTEAEDYDRIQKHLSASGWAGYFRE